MLANTSSYRSIAESLREQAEGSWGVGGSGFLRQCRRLGVPEKKWEAAGALGGDNGAGRGGGGMAVSRKRARRGRAEEEMQRDDDLGRGREQSTTVKKWEAAASACGGDLVVVWCSKWWREKKVAKTGIVAVIGSGFGPVVAIGSDMDGGTAFNVIRDNAEFGGTLRSLSTKGLQRLQQRLKEWVSHRNHRGNICEVDFIWLLNPNRYRKLLKTSWNLPVFGMFKYLLQRASLTESAAFAFLKADSDGDGITYSGFCETLRHGSVSYMLIKGLDKEEMKDL
ncbi:hypothetical protein Droror1_Dr00013015 [Drosera rotundifolia]